MSIQRYTPFDSEVYGPSMLEVSDGKYILYADHAAEVARLTGERDDAILGRDHMESLRVKWMLEKTDLFEAIKNLRAERDAAVAMQDRMTAESAGLSVSHAKAMQTASYWMTQADMAVAAKERAEATLLEISRLPYCDSYMARGLAAVSLDALAAAQDAKP